MQKKSLSKRKIPLSIILKIAFVVILLSVGVIIIASLLEFIRFENGFSFDAEAWKNSGGFLSNTAADIAGFFLTLLVLPFFLLLLWGLKKIYFATFAGNPEKLSRFIEGIENEISLRKMPEFIPVFRQSSKKLDSKESVVFDVAVMYRSMAGFMEKMSIADPESSFPPETASKHLQTVTDLYEKNWLKATGDPEGEVYNFFRELSRSKETNTFGQK